MWNIVESIPGLKVKVPQANNHNPDKWTYKRKQFDENSNVEMFQLESDRFIYPFIRALTWAIS